MNEAGANALYEAERRGVRQISYETDDSGGGRCAMGVLLENLFGIPKYVSWPGAVVDHFRLSMEPMECPLCDRKEYGEPWVIAHLNNDHGLTFSEIARKLGPDAA